MGLVLDYARYTLKHGLLVRLLGFSRGCGTMLWTSHSYHGSIHLIFFIHWSQKYSSAFSDGVQMDQTDHHLRFFSDTFLLPNSFLS